MTAPTERQRDVMVAIAAAWSRDGVCASYRELCDELGFRSTNALMDHLRLLRLKQLIELPDYKGRALLPTDEGWRALGVDTPVIPARCRPLLMRCNRCGVPVVYDALGARLGPPFVVYWNARHHGNCS